MSLLNAELITFRLDDHEAKLEHLLERSQEFNAAITVIKENTRMVTDNIKQHTERLRALEDDSKQKNYLKNVLLTWPTAIFKLICVCAVVVSVVNWDKVRVIVGHFVGG